jgi:hypothetical protein
MVLFLKTLFPEAIHTLANLFWTQAVAMGTVMAMT